MSFQRFFIPPDLDNRLRYFVGRVGLTANLLCRCGICLSLKEPGIPDLSLHSGAGEGQGREMNRFTLLGKYDPFFFAVLRERLLQDALPLDDEIIEQQFKAHLFRGIGLLTGRIRCLEDIADLVREANRNISSDYADHQPDLLVGEGTEPSSMAPTLLMSEVSPLTLWEQEPPSLEIEPNTGRPRLALALANDAQTRLINETVTRYHYLHTPVDTRCSLLAYLVVLGGQRIGCVIFGRPEATKVGGWYGSVAEKSAGKCRLSRWEILNLCRFWLDPIVQEKGAWHSPDLLPGFYDRRNIFHSVLATTVIEMALASIPIDYLIAFPPVDVHEPYQIQEVLSYCDPSQHKGTIYQKAGFRLERENGRGLQTYVKPVRPLTLGEDAYVRLLAEHSPRSKHYRALRTNTAAQFCLWE